MALTGSLLFFFLEPGGKAKGVMYLVKELHELGEGLIPVFIILHVGAVVMHAVFRHPIWRRMFW
jgi:cytochrome b561